jgi:hypothetical protein
VPGATGAALEVSAPGPTATFNENPFNNPNGTGRDHNGVDGGSVSIIPLPGTSGTVTLRGQDLGLAAAMQHVVRVQALRLGAPAGEAGDVSTLAMDGVRAADGGFVGNGFGISLSGSDGYLTSNIQVGSGPVQTSVETFDRGTNTITATAASATNAIFQTTGWGTWAGDVGLVERFDINTGAVSANVLDPVSAGTLGPAWTPPYGPNVFIDQAAPNSANDDAAFVAARVNPDSSVGFDVFTSNLHDRTFGPLIDIGGPLSGMVAPALGGFGENPGTRTGVAGFGDFNDFCGAPTIVTVDLAGGTVGTITGAGSGIPNGLAVDPASNLAAVPNACSDGTTLENVTSTLSIYDLGARTATAATYRGIAGLYAAADPQHGLFMLAQPLPADVTTNNNATSALLVFDEQGRQLASIERFNLFNTLLPINSANLQLDPAHRTGYLLGPMGLQLAPFSY